MQRKKLKSLYTNEVWDLVELPQGRKAVGSKWGFKLKVNVDGSLKRYKARLVVQGFSQKPGLACDKTFSPVVKFESVRSKNPQFHSRAKHMDIKYHFV